MFYMDNDSGVKRLGHRLMAQSGQRPSKVQNKGRLEVN